MRPQRVKRWYYVGVLADSGGVRYSAVKKNNL